MFKNIYKMAFITLVLLAAVCLEVVGLNQAKEAEPAFSSSTSDQQGISISLYSLNSSVNKPFHLKNILPGDTYSQDFNLSIKDPTDSAIKLEMTRTSSLNETDLSQKMNIKISIEDDQKNVLSVFEGKITDLLKNPPMVSINSNTNSLLYHVTMQLPAETGNDYQGQKFSGDLKWDVIDKTAVANPHTGKENNLPVFIVIFSLTSLLPVYWIKKGKFIGLKRKIKNWYVCIMKITASH